MELSPFSFNHDDEMLQNTHTVNPTQLGGKEKRGRARQAMQANAKPVM